MAKQLTRRELHDLVWSKPTIKVAEDLGISNMALAKICAKHRVPVPGRGHWAKVAAGKPAKQAIFREISGSDLNIVQIHGSALAALEPEVKAARLHAEREIPKGKVKLGAPSDRREGDESPDFVERLTKKLDQTKPNAHGLCEIAVRKLPHVAITKSMTSRVTSLFQEITKAAGARGYSLEFNDHGACLIIDGEPISIAFRESIDRIAHKVTEAEAAALQRWQMEQERKRRRGEWLSEWDKPKVPELDYLPNGLLIVEIDQGSHWDGLRRKFADGKRQHLENMTSNILVAMATCAAQHKAKRAEQERRRLEQIESDKRYREAERRKMLEQKRWEYLERHIQRLERAKRLEIFLQEYRQQGDEKALPRSFDRLVTWCEKQVNTIRSKIAPDQVEGELEKLALMDDDTNIPSWTKFD